LTHEPSGVDLCTGGDDFRFSNTFLLRSGRERCRNFGAEDDILNEDTFNGYTPLIRDVTDDFGNLKSDGLALGDDALDGACAYDMTKCGLSTLDESLAEVCNAKCCSIGVADLEVDDRVTEKGNISLSSHEDKDMMIAHFNVDVVTGTKFLNLDNLIFDCIDVHSHDGLASDGANLNLDVDDA
jgi:hypothetical protein